jgi:nucleoside-diphosphate-sugar epimerase
MPKSIIRSSDIYADETVLITGGGGTIGSRLSKKLLNLGADVIVVDDFSSGHEFNIPDSVQVVRGNICSVSTVSKAFKIKPTYIFHLAALFANKNSVDHPGDDLEVNGRGTLNVLKESVDSNSVKRVVYASSSCVYNKCEPLPYKESEMIDLRFNTPYEITKAFGEAYCNYFNKSKNVDISRARIFNSYGPGEIPGKYRNVIPNFIYKARQGKPLPITGSGNETRDFTYVSDVVNGLLAIGSEPIASGEVYNLATGEETSIKKLADLINSVSGNDSGIEYYPRRDWDNTQRRQGSIQKATKHLGYEPSVELIDGITETVAWFDDNWSHIRDIVNRTS